MATKRDWERVGRALIAQRKARGFEQRTDFLRHLVRIDAIPQANMSTKDRILGDLERGDRKNYSPGTLSAAELWYGFAQGTIKRILAGETVAERDNAQQLSIYLDPNSEWQVSAGVDEISDEALAEIIGKLVKEMAERRH